MELVTLAHVVLNRIGSASRGSTFSHKHVEQVREVPDGSTQSLRALVMKIATDNGESADALKDMRQQTGWHSVQNVQTIDFNVQGPSTSYSQVYATCFAYPALKIDNRYFKLEEVSCKS